MPQTAIRAFRDDHGTVPIQVWLDDLEEAEPRAYHKCLQRILLLEQLGYELQRPVAVMLRDGIYELRTKVGTVNYRVLYFFCGQNLCCLSHGLTKERKVPDAQIEIAISRKRLVERDADRYTAQWEA